jgi:hypothetical protein
MRIVSETVPPSMGVVVDTIVFGKVELAIQPSHAVKKRIDVVFAKGGVVGVMPGTPTASPAPPALATGMRELAKIYVREDAHRIVDNNIEEAA